MTAPSPSRLSIPRRAVMAGGMAVSALVTLPGAAQAARRRRPVVGVLTPSVYGSQAAAVRARGDALVAGLKVGLGGVQKKVLRAEVIGGYAGVTSAAEKLIKAGANVIVAATSEAAFSDLATLCHHRKVALVMAGSGAQVAAPTTVGGRPTALHAGAHHWQSSLSMGSWAATKLGRTLHHVVAAPDAGYDSVFALRRGFTGAGGTVVGLTITHDGTPLADTVREVKAARAGVVAISASGTRAHQIAQALRAGGVRARFVLDPTAVDSLAGFKGAADGAHLGSASLNEKRRAELAKALRRHKVGAVSTASIVGHDTGALIAAGVARLGARGWDRLPARLVGVTVAGVRGKHRVDASGQVSVPLTVVKVRKKSGKRRPVVVAARARIGSAPAMAVVQGRLSSGYVNEYATT